MADSLEENFFLEPITEKRTLESLEEASSSDESKPTKKPKTKKPKKERKIEWEKLDVELTPHTFKDEIKSENIVEFIKDLYKKEYKVKSSSKVLSVVVICMSAERVITVMNEMRKKLKTAKLFARHLKAQEQALELKNGDFFAACGTAGRVLKITRIDNTAIPLASLDYLIIDGFVDGKKRSIMDVASVDLKDLVDHVKDSCKVVLFA